MNLLRSIMCGLVLAAASICTAQTANELETYVSFLASDALEGRNDGSKGYDKAAKYIYDECKRAGLQVEYQSVPRRKGGSCKNVIAWIEGENLDNVVVVGAHLDHVGVGRAGVYNGADDNASGSAAVLGLAKRFAKGTKPCVTIAFQWYTGEEDGYVGSRYYVNNPTLPKSSPSIKKHVFMLNLDMVGRLRRTGLLVIDPDLPPILEKLYAKHACARRITLINESGSDQVSFRRMGVKEAFLHTGLHRDYHRTTDDADKINYEGIEEICDYAYDLINAVIGTEPNYNIW